LPLLTQFFDENCSEVEGSLSMVALRGGNRRRRARG